LASASPRRRELLTRVGLAHQVVVADVDESSVPGEDPLAYVQRVAEKKAQAVRALHPEASILAADTTVEIDHRILGKAESESEAASMLRSLSARTHRVATGFVVLTARQAHREVVVSEVAMVELSPAMIAGYVASGEWRGKAGAYAIQGIAGGFVSSVRGSFTNIVGLPLAEVLAALASLGAAPPDWAHGVPA
jgi:septum formation protein